MTPKIKAKKLMAKCLDKRIALMVVKEVLTALEDKVAPYTKKYWQEVKTELEKL